MKIRQRMTMRTIAFLLLLTSAIFAEETVPHLPSSARLFLRVPDGSPPIKSVRVSQGEAVPGYWEPTPEKRERLTDIRFPIHWWRWTEFTVSFIPTHTGTIELDLNGPWGEARPGVLQQQEVLWDDLTATGTTLENGGFEERKGSQPAGWESPWRTYPDSTVWPFPGAEPFQGKHLAASWHGRPLTQSLPVKAGEPVTLNLNVRSATPAGHVGLKPITGDTPAHATAAQLRRGVNLGNNWESPPGGWGIRYDLQDLDQIAAEGFDHIRVPVAWQYRMKDGKIDPAFLAEIEPMLRHAISKRLRVILNWQHFDDLCRDPEGRRGEFLKGWTIISDHFKDWPASLSFELLNEPNSKLDGPALASVFGEAIQVIRRTNPNRTILVSPAQWATTSALDRLVLPESDRNLLVSLHCYDPFEFTHQGANWVGLTDLKGITYPGPPARPVSLPASLKESLERAAWIESYNTSPAEENPCSAKAVERILDDAIAWSKFFGRPVHLGEFGSHQVADLESRRRYSRDVRVAAQNRNIPWTLWDWKAGFGYWNPETKQALLKDALFGDEVPSSKRQVPKAIPAPLPSN